MLEEAAAREAESWTVDEGYLVAGSGPAAGRTRGRDARQPWPAIVSHFQGACKSEHSRRARAAGLRVENGKWRARAQVVTVTRNPSSARIWRSNHRSASGR